MRHVKVSHYDREKGQEKGDLDNPHVITADDIIICELID
jgi:hypothetical protein